MKQLILFTTTNTITQAFLCFTVCIYLNSLLVFSTHKSLPTVQVTLATLVTQHMWAKTIRCFGCLFMSNYYSERLMLNYEISVHNRNKCVLLFPFRCATSQTTYYTGKRCDQMNINRSILGALVGGAAGTVVLTLAIWTVIRRAQWNTF